MSSTRRARLLTSLLAGCVLVFQLPAAAADQAGPVVETQQYISASWQALTRSMTSCTTLSGAEPHKETFLYLPADFPAPPALLKGRIELARGMVENFFFEIAHYGMILNANRGRKPARRGKA